MLKAEGSPGLPRRHDEERPARHRLTAAAVVDVRQLDLTPRPLRSRFGGLYMFVSYLARIPFVIETIRQIGGVGVNVID